MKKLQLTGVVIPINLFPSFGTAIFKKKGSETMYAQEATDSETIKKFSAIDAGGYKPIPVNERIDAEVGGPVIHAFLFSRKKMVVGTKLEVRAALKGKTIKDEFVAKQVERFLNEKGGN